MALRYACFLSYQRGNDVVDRFARELFQTLSNKLGLVTQLPIWFDTARIDAGDDWRVQSVEALQSSVCMVPILTPTYFSADRPYCTREFLGMQRLEAFRWTRTARKDSFIIPVVLRGTDRLPNAVKKRRMIFDFSDYLAFGPKQFRSPRFARSVADLSKQIAKLCDTYTSLEAQKGLDASQFALPSEAETIQWLKSVEAPS
jgi:TIR domain